MVYVVKWFYVAKWFDVAKWFYVANWSSVCGNGGASPVIGNKTSCFRTKQHGSNVKSFPHAQANAMCAPFIHVTA